VPVDEKSHSFLGRASGAYLRAVWGYDHDPGTNVVDVYIGYLRRKLRDAVLPRRS
jgi:DNA-binding response OmpR family regulator